MYSVFFPSWLFTNCSSYWYAQPTGEAAGDDVESDSDSDDDDDDVRVTIGDIKTGAPQYTYAILPLCFSVIQENETSLHVMGQ